MIIRGLMIGLVCLFGLLIVGQASTPAPRLAAVTAPVPEWQCSKAPVPLPRSSEPTSLQQCQAAVRAYIKAMVGNVRVVVACREEFVLRANEAARRVGHQLKSGAGVLANNKELIGIIPEIERGAEQQLKKQNTLALCKAHLSKAHQSKRPLTTAA